jgi:hypothetical protein
MTKSESRECLKLQAWSKFPDIDTGLLARSYSALIRSARTTKSQNEILTYAASVPAVVQHPEFIIR